eukprot:606787_1
MAEEDSIVIFDNGSQISKIGFSGDDYTQCTTFPTIRGRVGCHYGVMLGFNYDKKYIGEDAIQHSGQLLLKYPVKHGIIQNFDDIQDIWHHTFYSQLRIAPEEHPVFITEKALNPKDNREKITQIMFETFHVPAFYLICQMQLCLLFRSAGSNQRCMRKQDRPLFTECVVKL